MVDDHGGHGVHARAAVFLGQGDAEQAQLAELRKSGTFSVPSSSCLAACGSTSLRVKSRDHLAQGGVLFGGIEQGNVGHGDLGIGVFGVGSPASTLARSRPRRQPVDDGVGGPCEGPGYGASLPEVPWPACSSSTAANHAFRVQFALPPRHTSDGFPTRVLYGFTLLFQKMLRTWQPDYVVRELRHGQELPHGSSTPTTRGTAPRCPRTCGSSGRTSPSWSRPLATAAISLPGFEADDVLGTLATQFASDDLEVYLVTSDKDFAQLVNDNVQILDEMKGDVLDADAVEDKFGVGAPRASSTCSPSPATSPTTCPACPGVGIKTAVKFLKEYGDLEGVLAAAADGKIGGKRGQSLIDEADMARLSQTLVTIKTDVPTTSPSTTWPPAASKKTCSSRSSTSGSSASSPASCCPTKRRWTPPTSRWPTRSRRRTAAARGVRGPSWISFELALSDDGSREPVGVCLRVNRRGRGRTSRSRRPVRCRSAGRAQRSRSTLLSPMSPWPRSGTRTKRRTGPGRARARGSRGIVGDTRLLDYVLASHRRTHSLRRRGEPLPGPHAGHEHGERPMRRRRQSAPSAEHANVVAALHDRLLESKRLEGTSARDLRGDRAAARHADPRAMEAAGIRLDVEAIALGVDEDIAGRLERGRSRLPRARRPRVQRCAPSRTSRIVLFEELGLTKGKKVEDRLLDRVRRAREDRPRAPAPRQDPRVPLPRQAPGHLPARSCPGTWADDGRIHTTFNQAVAATGRLSSVDPQPAEHPDPHLRGAPDPGVLRPGRGPCLPVGGLQPGRAPGARPRLRRIPVLLEGFSKGEDIHARTAVEVFGATPDRRGDGRAQRSAAKAINFGLIYGMSAFRLARDLGIERKAAQAYMDAYFARMPSVKDWIEATKDSCREHGYVETLFGRRRIIPEIHSTSWNEQQAGEREAVNTVIQGTAADLIKKAMLRVDAALAAADTGATLLLQVHDELLLEVPEGALDEVTKLVHDEMVAAAELSVPLVVTTASGATWNQAHG